MAATAVSNGGRKKQARRPGPPPGPAAPEMPGPLDATGFEPVRLAAPGADAAKSVPLFYIGDIEYRVLARPGMNIALQYMHLFREQGEAVAMDYMMAALLGAEGYEALRNYDGLSAADFSKIVEIATRLTLGSLEAPKE